MEDYTEPFEVLKQILRNVREPDALDDHPWSQGLFVQEAVRGDPALQRYSPGGQLVAALAGFFPQMMPSAPPRRGKRLDPRWGEFGLLAALYFTPFNHGRPYPATLMDAWGRIDEAILYFVYGRPAAELSLQEVQKYQLVGADLEFGSPSTLSDWHKKGLQHFAGILLDQERFLARTQNRPSALLREPQAESVPIPDQQGRARRKRTSCLVWLSLALILFLVLAGLGGIKASRVYRRGQLVYQEAYVLRDTLNGPINLETVRQAAPMLATLQSDLTDFEQEARPLLWLAPRLGWIPVYGNDVQASPALLQLARHLVDASLLSSAAAQPLLDQIASDSSGYDPASLTYLLVQAQPGLEQARGELERALAVRQGLDAGRLSPRVQNLLVKELDPLMALGDQGLSLALALPDVLGAGKDGPKTYLLLVQNEDELRPTGGFITAFGNLVIHNGQVISLKFEPMDGTQEDWSKPYPAAPWQLQEYMNSPVLILRDSNWFADYPTSAMWAEYLYAYTHDHSVDGVIAFDQRFLVMLLGELGPLQVEDAPYPITEQNVVEYMRQAKNRPDNLSGSADWIPKEFISKIGEAVLQELNSDRDHDWRRLAEILVQGLNEHHLLVQFDNAVFASLAAERGWDGALLPEGGDFLMVTDTNVGFNKTNAVVETSLAYDVDLQDVNQPVGILTVVHKNNASPDVPCFQWNDGQIQTEKGYPIDRCYWAYLRVYKQAGTELLEATPRAIPGNWMWSGLGVPARVDEVDEDLPGAQIYGTLLVLPGGASQTTSFTFALPAATLLQENSGVHTYHLKVRKQPGTLAVPLTIRIHLPGSATLESASLPGTLRDQSLLVQTDLRTDVEIEVVFSLP